MQNNIRPSEKCMKMSGDLRFYLDNRKHSRRNIYDFSQRMHVHLTLKNERNIKAYYVLLKASLTNSRKMHELNVWMVLFIFNIEFLNTSSNIKYLE